MSEEDQMMRAIAMSLGQEVSMEQRSDSPEVCSFHLLKIENYYLLLFAKVNLSGKPNFTCLAAVEMVLSLSATGSSTSSGGRGQESKRAGRRGGGALLGALHGG